MESFKQFLLRAAIFGGALILFGFGVSSSARGQTSPETVAPAVIIETYDTPVDEGSLFSGSGAFSDPDADPWTATVDYGDGSSAQELPLNPDQTFSLTHTYPDEGDYKLQVTVDDHMDGTGSASVTVAAHNVPPAVEAGPEADILTGETFLSSGAFTDPGEDAWTATVDYGDGSGAQPLSLNPDKTFELSHIYTSQGAFTVTTQVNDGAENGTDTTTVTVQAINAAPAVDAGPDATIGEGSDFSSSGSFSDPDADTWTATVDYGDGSGEGSLALNEDGTFSLNHTYMVNGEFTVTVTVSDGVESGVDTALVTVENIAPTVDAGADAAILAGETFSSSGSFSDPGTDTWSANVDFGDGSGEQTLALNGENTFDLSHTYSAEGTYTVTVTVSDGEGSGSDQATVTVDAPNTAPTVDAGPDVAIVAGETFNSSGSFSDPDEDSWSATIDYGDGSGEQTLALNGDKTFSLSHTYSSAGTYTVTVTVSDGEGSDSDQATLTVDAPVNTAPSVNAGGDGSLNEGGAFNSSGSFNDPDEDAWSATVNYGDGSGEQSLALNEDKTFSLNHTYENDGTYTVTVTVSDEEGSGSDTAVVTVNNVAPTVNAGSGATIDEGGTFTSSGSFTDPGSDSWSATVDWGDGSGSQALALNADKTFNLSHVYESNGSYTVTVAVSDEVASGSATTTVTVNNINPTVKAGPNATKNEGETFNRSGSFTDPGGDVWTATVNYGDGSGDLPLTLHANKTFNLSHVFEDDGLYTVTVTVNDGEGSGSDSIVVNVRNLAPAAQDDDYQVSEGGELLVAAPGVLGNDSDPGSEALTAVLDSSVSNGTIVLNGDGSFTYTPDPDFSGTDGFTYRAGDGVTTSAVATVTIAVGGTNDSPTDLTLSNSSIDENLGVGTEVGVFSTTDADTDDTHTYRLVDGEGGEDNSRFEIAGDVLQTAEEFDYETQASHSILVETADASGATFLKSFTIEVVDVNEAPVALGEAFDVENVQPLEIQPDTGVLSNDTDPENDALTAVLVDPPAQAEEFTLNPDGSFTYMPVASYLGEDRFTYYAEDPGGLKSETVEVLISILDADSPRLTWVMPVIDGAQYEVGNLEILLQVDASDTDAIDYVRFSRWDAVGEQHLEIGVAEAAPYAIEFNTSVLNLGFNQINAIAFDVAGNASGQKFIWLYKVPAGQQIFLPLVLTGP